MLKEDQEILFERILEALERDKLYLDPAFSMDNLAVALHSNRTYVSQTVRAMTGMGFSDWMAHYRIGIVRAALTEMPKMTIEQACAVGGYTTKETFFRQIKKVTGGSLTQLKENVLV